MFPAKFGTSRDAHHFLSAVTGIEGEHEDIAGKRSLKDGHYVVQTVNLKDTAMLARVGRSVGAETASEGLFYRLFLRFVVDNVGFAKPWAQRKLEVIGEHVLRNFIAANFDRLDYTTEGCGLACADRGKLVAGVTSFKLYTSAREI